MNKTRLLVCFMAMVIAGSTVMATASPQSRNRRNTTTQRKSATVLEVSDNNVTFESDRGMKTFYVTCDAAWSVEGKVEWGDIEIASDKKSLTFYATPNNYETSRSGFFYVVSGSLTRRIDVKQMGREEARIEVSQTEMTYDNYTGTQSISVVSNRNWQVSDASESWFEAIKDAGVVQVNVQRNESTRARSGYFTITAGNKTVKVKVKQAGFEPYLSISESSLDFAADGGSLSVNVDGEIDGWQYENSASWTRVSKVGNKLTVYADPNPDPDSRSSYIVVSYPGSIEKRINVQQAANRSSKPKPAANSYSSSYTPSYNYNSGYSKPSWWKGRVRVGIEMDGEIGRYYVFGKSSEDPSLIYGFGGGLILGFGKYSDVINISLGAKYMQYRYQFNMDNGYKEKGKVGDYVVVPANLKLNTFRMGSSKFYLGGGYEYGFAVGNKDVENFMDWNAGIGINSRHVDWYIFYKQFFGDDNAFFTGDYKDNIGTSLTIYF